MQQLIKTLQRIDKKGYKAYNDIKGIFSFSNFTLHIDHIQADPFASPSRVRVIINRTELTLGSECDENHNRKRAVIDFFAKEIAKYLRESNDNKSIIIDGPGQEVIDRTAVTLHPDTLDIRLSVHLPARGRTILGRKAKDLLVERLPSVIDHAVQKYSRERLNEQLKLVDDQTAIRSYLHENNYITFIANGSILPRESGVSSRPLPKEKAVPFSSPSSLEVEIDLPHYGKIKGMGIKAGVNIIVGGGYHGKSTLLEAIENGVYDHRAGDGREFVITDASACKVRAEDGRSVANVNISPFISNLPIQKDTNNFSTENASGSTSQAASIIESLEAGTNCLLIDEDTSATNFMIRDARMQALVAREKEPITPFIDKVRSLYENHGVSTILVVGGAGDYFEVADYVIMMEEYIPKDVTDKAKQIAHSFGSIRQSEAGQEFGHISQRIWNWDSFHAKKGKRDKVSAKGMHTILYGRDAIDLSAVEQLINGSQTSAIANIIRYASHHMREDASVSEVLDTIDQVLIDKGLDEISPFKGKHPGDMAVPRRYEIAAAINRHRKLRAAQRL